MGAKPASPRVRHRTWQDPQVKPVSPGRPSARTIKFSNFFPITLVFIIILT